VERTDLRLVSDEAALNAMLRALEGADRIALDTEFHAEHRYKPALMLVQIASPDGRIWIVDPKAVPLHPLGPLLERALVVVHGGAQDVELLHRATKTIPARLFDTQRAGGLVGLGYPSRLGALLGRTLGRPIDKGAGLTDWSTRPLTPRQIEYAAADAAVLLPLAEALERRLAEVGRLEWARAASDELVAESIGRPPDTDSWMGWDIAHLLDDDERKALAALFRWREGMGSDNDQPPRQVLSDALALDLARRRPMTLGELTENRRIPQGMIRRFGSEILGVLRRVAQDPTPAPSPPGPDQLLLTSALELWAGVHERQTGLARHLVLPRGVAVRVAALGPEALDGWRGEAIGPQVDALMNGRLALRVVAERQIEVLSAEPPVGGGTVEACASG